MRANPLRENTHGETNEGKKMSEKPMKTNEETALLLEMARENETARVGLTIAVKEAVWAFMKADGEPVDVKASRKAEGHKASQATGVNTASTMSRLMDIKKPAKAITNLDLFNHGVRFISVSLNTYPPQRVNMPVLTSPMVTDAINGSSKVRRLIRGLMAVTEAKFMEASRLNELRRNLSVGTAVLEVETDEEGNEYRAAPLHITAAFGLADGSLIRTINAEDLVFQHPEAKQGSHQMATLDRLSLNADTVVQWFKTEPQATAYYCGTCYRSAVNGYQADGVKKAPVNWGADQVARKFMASGDAVRYPDHANDSTPNACPTCATPRFLLSFNSNTAHLPLLSHTDETGVATTKDGKAVKAVAFRMAKREFKAAKGVLTHKVTPHDSIGKLMEAKVEFRTTDGGTKWRMARLVPVWWQDAQDGGDMADHFGLAIQPLTLGQDGDTVAHLG